MGSRNDGGSDGPAELNGPAPLVEVDRVEITVLIDNVTDSLSRVPPAVTPEWVALHRAGMEQMAGSCLCCANHGLSLLIRTFSGGRGRTMLFDAGPVDFAVGYNGSRLGVAFDEVEAVMLSHGHWDHAGGLLAAFDLIGGKDVPTYLHPGMFRQRAIHLPTGELLPITEIPGPDALASKGARPLLIEEPTTALNGAFYVSGEVPRITAYETGMKGHMRRADDEVAWEPDPLIMDERFLAVNVRGKGIVVFSACSHAGIVNVMHAARAAIPGAPIHAIIGGFHLAGGNEDVIDATVADLAQFGARFFFPGHCTGWRAVGALERAFGEKVVPLAVGMIVRL